MVCGALFFGGCATLHGSYENKVRDQFSANPPVRDSLLAEADLAGLPAPVRRYVVRTGSVGKPVPRSFRIEFTAKMWRTRGGKPFDASSEQYNFLGENPSRIFFMKASQSFIPFRVLHAYVDHGAMMRVRVAGLFTAVDLNGTDLAKAETVTLLNDLCVFAPGALGDPRLAWEAIDSLSARVRFTNGVHKVSATLNFNDSGELTNFVSDDRSALQDDGTLKQVRWSTPMGDYREFDGRRLASRAEAIYHYPDGDFTYGSFETRSVRYNLGGPEK